MSINVTFETPDFTNNGSSTFINTTANLDNKDNLWCPIWIVYGFLIIFFFGSCVNLFEGLALLRSKKNGLMLILLQINLTDTISTPVALLEIFTSYHRTWKFNSQTCMLYNGTEILSNTIIIYLTICLNFHIITFWNLYYVETVRNNKNPLTNRSYNDESSSSECLVTRIVNIDYRKRKTDIPVTFPVIFLWILCLSISMPKYVLSATIEIESRTLCVILENSYGKILYSLLLLFSTLIPCSLLIISLLVLFYKLSKTTHKNIDSALTKQFKEIRRLLIFSIIFTIFYIITTYQRHILIMSITIREFFIFENYYHNTDVNVYQTIFYYLGRSFRGIICYFFVNDVKRAVRNKLIFCCANKE